MNEKKLTDWQLYALLRRRFKENVRDSQDTLTSIMRLVRSLPNLPLGRSVQHNVQVALDALKKVNIRSLKGIVVNEFELRFTAQQKTIQSVLCKNLHEL